jgi:hypothetical protein
VVSSTAASNSSRATWRFVALLWLVLAAGLLLAGCDSGQAEDSASTSPEPVDSDVRVFLIGVDGATWRIMDPMIERGELPNIASMIERGARADLQTMRPTLSPIIWTSIATSKFAGEHGIRNFWRKREASEGPADGAEQAMLDMLESIGYINQSEQEEEGQKTLYKSTDWKAKPFWDVFTERGLKSVILGWWVTYPVQPLDGVMVSDRYLFNRFELEAEASGTDYIDSGRHVHPPELEPDLRRLVVKAEEIGPSRLERFVRGPVEIDDEMVLHDPIDELRITLAKDESYHRMALDLLERDEPDFFTVYYEGVDIASHYFWKYLFPEEWNEAYPDFPVDPDERERYADAITEYYRLVDEYIGELMRFADDRTMVILMSDHGFVTGRRDEDSGLAHYTVSGVHSGSAPDGVLVVSGFGAERGVRLERATVLDIAPTLLAVHGLPVARDMEGRVLLSALDRKAFSYPLPVSFVDTFDPAPKDDP